MRSRFTALVAVTALIYLVHGLAFATGALLHSPGMNPPVTLWALALTGLGAAAYTLARGRRFGQGDASVMWTFQMAAGTAMSHTAHLNLAALSDGFGLSMLGAYASWLLAWPAAVAYYAGLAAWLATISARSHEHLTLAAMLLTVQAVATTEIVRALRRRVEQLTTHDPLTEVLNRRGIEETAATLVARSARRGRPVSVALIDLDDLRQVNNPLGHQAGDALLVTAATEWRTLLGDAAGIGRIGGDEFVLVFDGLEATAAHTPLATAQSASSVRWTAGLAQPQPGETLDQVIARADAEMYTFKDLRWMALAQE